MSDLNALPPDYGRRLKEWLPTHWRVRDADTGGDLGGLLAVCGELLDALHATVNQRLYDSFPDADASGRRCQDWLIPYFARLLDVRLVSPDAEGRRAEVANAVAWRQRKGARVSIEKIAEAVGQFEVEIQEGWKRLAMTPRIDRTLLPEKAYGEEPVAGPTTPALCAAHPGLPAVTPDLSYGSRAVRCPAGNAASASTTFPGEAQPLNWRQTHRHGAPCIPDSYQDVSRRTADLRTPDWRRGFYHPRRMLLYVPPPEGFFRRIHTTASWASIAPLIAAALGKAGEVRRGPILETLAGLHRHPAVECAFGLTEWNGATLPLISLRGLTDGPVRVRGVVDLDAPAVYRFENLWFDNRVEIRRGAAQLFGCAVRQLRMGVAEREAVVIEAHSCLFKRIEAARSLARLEYVTVFEALLAERLEASDSILLPALRKDTVDSDVPAAGCIRYSRLAYIPKPAVSVDPKDPKAPLFDNDERWVSQKKRSLLRCCTDTCTTLKPLFWSEIFGEPGCGVLHPDCVQAVQSGAEDGGEMGAYHERRYVLRRQAVLEKLQEYLPVGMEAVIITDPSLACAPPKATTT